MNARKILFIAWKEFRTQRTVWLALLAGCALLHFAFALQFALRNSRWVGGMLDIVNGTSVPNSINLALGMAYAAACAAILFAGEKEERTQLLLKQFPLTIQEVVAGKFLTAIPSLVLFYVAISIVKTAIWSAVFLAAAPTIPELTTAEISRTIRGFLGNGPGLFPLQFIIGIAPIFTTFGYTLLFSVIIHRIPLALALGAILATIVMSISTAVLQPVSFQISREDLLLYSLIWLASGGVPFLIGLCLLPRWWNAAGGRRPVFASNPSGQPAGTRSEFIYRLSLAGLGLALWVGMRMQALWFLPSGTTESVLQWFLREIPVAACWSLLMAMITRQPWVAVLLGAIGVSPFDAADTYAELTSDIHQYFSLRDVRFLRNLTLMTAAALELRSFLQVDRHAPLRPPSRPTPPPVFFLKWRCLLAILPALQSTAQTSSVFGALGYLLTFFASYLLALTCLACISNVSIGLIVASLVATIVRLLIALPWGSSPWIAWALMLVVIMAIVILPASLRWWKRSQEESDETGASLFDLLQWACKRRSPSLCRYAVLAWRELRSGIPALLVWGGLGVLSLYFVWGAVLDIYRPINQAERIVPCIMLALSPWVFGLLSFGVDHRQGVMGFLAARGVSAASVWTAKQSVWLGLLVVMMLACFSIDIGWAAKHEQSLFGMDFLYESPRVRSGFEPTLVTLRSGDPMRMDTFRSIVLPINIDNRVFGTAEEFQRSVRMYGEQEKADPGMITERLGLLGVTDQSVQESDPSVVAALSMVLSRVRRAQAAENYREIDAQMDAKRRLLAQGYVSMLIVSYAIGQFLSLAFRREVLALGASLVLLPLAWIAMATCADRVISPFLVALPILLVLFGGSLYLVRPWMNEERSWRRWGVQAGCLAFVLLWSLPGFFLF